MHRPNFWHSLYPHQLEAHSRLDLLEKELKTLFPARLNRKLGSSKTILGSPLTCLRPY